MRSGWLNQVSNTQANVSKLLHLKIYKNKINLITLMQKILMLHNRSHATLYGPTQNNGTFINDVPYQGRQGDPRQPPKRTLNIEQDKVGRQVKNGQTTWDVINGLSQRRGQKIIYMFLRGFEPQTNLFDHILNDEIARLLIFMPFCLQKYSQ